MRIKESLCQGCQCCQPDKPTRQALEWTSKAEGISCPEAQSFTAFVSLLQGVQTILQNSRPFISASHCANRGFHLFFSFPFHLPTFFCCFDSPPSLHVCPQTAARTALPRHDDKSFSAACSSPGSQIPGGRDPLSIPMPWAADAPGILSVTTATKQFLGFLSP